jgi:Protein phosphatase 2C
MSWRIAAASAIGTSHLKTGKPCQDSHGVELLDTPGGTILICVIADGAGSAAHAETGSRMAVDKSLQLIREFLNNGGSVPRIDRDLAVAWIFEIQAAIASVAAEAGATPREFACTLLIAVIAPEAAAFVQVGDGAMVAGNEVDDRWTYVFWPQHGEFANSTNFVTASNAVDVMEFEALAGRIERFASFSDGVEHLVLHNASRSVHSPFFSAMLVPVQELPNPGLDVGLSESLSRYLNSEAVCERTDDDKSLVLASRKPILNPSVGDVSPS